MKIIETTQHIIPNTDMGRKYAEYMEKMFRNTDTYRSKYITSHQITLESKVEYEVEDES